MDRRGARLALLVAAIVLLPAAWAGASQVAYRNVSLAAAVRAASTVVEAIYLDETTDHATLHRFRTVRALRGSVRRGTVLRVREATYSAGIMTGRVFRTSGVMRSALISRLPAARSSALSPGRRYCLLLVGAVRVSEEQRELDWELAVAGGHVASPCPDVQRLVGPLRRPRAGRPGSDPPH